MTLSIIIAVAENNVIGKDNQLIWRLSDDLKNFKKLSSGHSIIMGRKTFDSIGRPLPKRSNIVITRNTKTQYEGCVMAYGIAQAIEIAAQLPGNDEIFIIGGAEIYKQILPKVDKVYLTKVHAKPAGDAFFDLDLLQDFSTTESKAYKKDEKNEYDITIATLERAAS